uniref:Major facilitator superfamily domain-containing protein 7-a-like n=1 Tax=Phallusia mammillata TaxID=59560 RepID=A0A6F9DTE9_9ASCI|nr:major facilitator superfamily domain-containing protein 7-a-like [Phallusia mammillata]
MSEDEKHENGFMGKSSTEILPDEYISYTKRWFVLLSVVGLNLAGAMIWLTFTPVAYKAVQFYNTDLDTINWLSLVFMVSGIPVGAVATWLLEAYGLKVALLLSAWLACIGSGIRIASVADGLSDDARIALLFVGQSLVALGQPFSMYAPAKTASTWFPEHQRALATTIAAVANPVGVVVAGLVSPLFVQQDGTLNAFHLLITTFAPAAFVALLTSVTMTSAEPPSPPSAGGIRKPGVFGDGLKDLFRNKNYMILVWTVGGGIGLYSTFATLLEQLLCPWGYSDTMAGICSAALTASGVVGAAVIGIYCDYSKQFSTMAKLCYTVTAVGTIIFAVVFHINMDYYILILIIGLGLFSFGVYPIGVELGAECTYPVGVATSSGLIMMSGQIQSIILVLILQSIGRPMSYEETVENNSKCYDFLASDETSTTLSSPLAAAAEQTTTRGETQESITYDLSVSMYVCAGYMALCAVGLLIFFRPKYLRMAAEQGEPTDHSSDLSSMHKTSKEDLSQL